VRWIDSGAYERILGGEYVRRGSPQDRKIADEFGEAASYYTSEAKKTVGEVADAARRAARAFTDAFKDATRR
jgi:hypothetical protein